MVTVTVMTSSEIKHISVPIPMVIVVSHLMVLFMALLDSKCS